MRKQNIYWQTFTVNNLKGTPQYRLRRTLHYFKRTRTHERTEYASVGVRALMEIIHVYLIGMPNNFRDVIIRVHIYRIICQLARVFNNQTIR